MRQRAGRRTGAKRKATITLPDLRFIEDKEERVRASRMRLATYDSPNIPTPAQVGELNSFARAHLKAQGGCISIESVRDVDGSPTALQHRRISSAIETLYRKGAIDSNQLVAAQTFQYYVAQAAMKSGVGSVNYDPLFIDGFSGPYLLPAERCIDSVRMLNKVYRNIIPEYHFILDWLSSNILEGAHYKEHAAQRWRNLTVRQSKYHFRNTLQKTLNSLISFFNITPTRRFN